MDTDMHTGSGTRAGARMGTGTGLRATRSSAGGRLRRVVVLVALSLAFGLVQLDATIVNVSLEAVRADLGGGVAMAQWLVDGYAVPFAALLLAGGALGDRLGQRRTCVAGFVVFALASVPAALAGGWALLIGARILQGVGAALMLPASLALVRELHPDPDARARALGVWGGIATTGFAAGPVVGGVLVTTLGWPAIFWLNVPVAGALALVVATLAPLDRPAARRGDPVGAALGVLALAALVGGIIEAGQGALLIGAGLLMLSVAAAVAFIVAERRVAEPLVPADVARSGRLRGSLVVGFGFNFAMYGALLCASLTLQSGLGLDPLQAGWRVLPMAVVVLVGATGSGFLTAAYGPRRPMVWGLSAGIVGAAALGVGGLVGTPTVVSLGLAGCGLVSLAMPAMTAVALGSVPGTRSGLAGGALNSVRQVGGAVGVAVMGAVVAAAGYGAGLSVAALVAMVVLGLSVLGALAATRPEPVEPQAEGRGA